MLRTDGARVEERERDRPIEQIATEASTAEERGKIARGMIVIGERGPVHRRRSRAGLWKSESGKKWLAPLVVFLCVTGLVLVLAATVEALAPFIYTIF